MDFKELLTEADTSFILTDINYTKSRYKYIRNFLNPEGVNAIAVKTNPLLEVLRIWAQNECALEAASLGELALAKAAGIKGENLIFDSPAKTQNEIEYITQNFNAAYINADSLKELNFLQDLPNSYYVGLRINPSIPLNSTKSLNVSSEDSKFGELLTSNKGFIQELKKYKKLDGLHLHQASMNDDFDSLIMGIRRVVDVANELDGIKFINIGGGLAYDYRESKDSDITEYFLKLRKSCPELFNGKYKLITEFGRHYYAGGSVVYTKVQNVKDSNSGGKTVISHIGADMFLRESYNSNDWFHKITVYDKNFNLVHNSNKYLYNIAGPLCFAGDIPFRNHKLPEVKIGDWLKIHDVGANTFALWSRHCSRQFPKVIGFDSKRSFLLKERESLDAIIDFWS